jgi:hypothetical protein
MKYFVCYTTRDTEVTSDLLQSFSKQLGRLGEVFVDIIDNNSLDKQKRVFAELDTSDVVILIESRNIYNSNWVWMELNRARSKQIPIKTVLLAQLKNLSEKDISEAFPF